MSLTIKNVIEKFVDEFINIDGGVDNIRDTEDDGNVYITGEKIKQFLQEELTLMLDGILAEIPPISYTRDMKSTYRNEYRQEVINIINSHR